jgi:L-alanine-DL-glutamate epimerase-like enolase superfamily enzyme
LNSIFLPIERVEIFGIVMPLVGLGFVNAYTTQNVQKSAVVRLTTSDGSVGLGNIDPAPGYSAETIEHSITVMRDRLAPAVMGLDAANQHRVVEAMDASLKGFLEAKAAIEMACVDLTARRLVFRLIHLHPTARLARAFLARWRLRMMDLAVAVQMKGFGWAFR